MKRHTARKEGDLRHHTDSRQEGDLRCHTAGGWGDGGGRGLDVTSIDRRRLKVSCLVCWCFEPEARGVISIDRRGT